MTRTSYATLTDAELLMIAYQKDDADPMVIELAVRLQNMLDMHRWDIEESLVNEGDFFGNP